MIYALLADGFEEIEAITFIDILRRAEKEVLIVGVTGETVTGAHGIKIESDILINQVSIDDADMLFLPGGMPGTLNLANNPDVNDIILKAFRSNKPIAAICAAPSVLGKAGILGGIRCCCFPGFESKLAGAIITSESVVSDKNIITAKGAGVAVEFALKAVEYLCGNDFAQKLKSDLQCK